jgi:hypothetical protein
MRSCPQTLQQNPHQYRIDAALNPHLRLTKLDVDRTGLWWGNIPDARLDYDRR